jgi:hypothetical protein
LVVALVLFAYSPVVGIAAIVCFVIILYTRNIRKTAQYAQQRYQEKPRAQVQVAQPYSGMDAGQPSSAFEGYQTAGPIGQFPLEDDRPMAGNGQVMTQSYMYRPSETMGDDTFERVGPNIDEKMSSFAY